MQYCANNGGDSHFLCHDASHILCGWGVRVWGVRVRSGTVHDDNDGDSDYDNNDNRQ